MSIQIQTRFLNAYIEHDTGWIRLFDRGFVWRDLRKVKAPRYVRTGYVRSLKIGWLQVNKLWPTSHFHKG